MWLQMLCRSAQKFKGSEKLLLQFKFKSPSSKFLQLLLWIRISKYSLTQKTREELEVMHHLKRMNKLSRHRP